MSVKSCASLVFSLICLFAWCDDVAPGKAARSGKSKQTAAAVKAAQKAKKQKLQKISITNLKIIGTAVMRFATDNRERLPKSLKELVTRSYLTDCKCYISPFDKKSVIGSAKDFDPVKNCSYAYLGMGVIAGNYGSEVPLVFEKPWCLPKNSNSIAVMMADGSARIVEIPNVNKKSCKEVVEFILKGVKLGSARKLILKNARAADLSR